MSKYIDINIDIINMLVDYLKPNDNIVIEPIELIE